MFEGSSEVNRILSHKTILAANPDMAKYIGVEVPGVATQSLDDVMQIQKQMLRDYNHALIDKGISMTRSQLRKKDTIDLRGLCTYDCNSGKADIPNIDSSVFLPEFISTNYWYDYIPCFNEGVMHINDARYIHWMIHRIDVQKREVEMSLRDYFRMDDIWQYGVGLRFIASFPDVPYLPAEINRAMNCLVPLQISVIEDELFSHIYKIIPYEEMRWTKNQIAIWENVVIAYAIDAEERVRRKYHSNNTLELTKIFFHMVLMSNQELWLNKPKAVRGKSKSSGARKIVAENSVDVPAPSKITRVVGGIKMQSEKPPKMPTKDTVVRYKTAVWKARGGVRRMKDGRLVPFKESIRRRKCLQNDADIPASHLVFKGTTIKKDE